MISHGCSDAPAGWKRAERGYVEALEVSNVVIVDLMEPVPVVLLRTAALSGLLEQ